MAQAQSTKTGAVKQPLAPQLFLLVDDEADKGWGDVLRRILESKFGPDIKLVVQTNALELAELDKEKYGLIFLDLRFGEQDHYSNDYTALGGFKLLQKFRNIASTNFSTPIILFTASTKIWIIEDLLQHGADGYYIKESPLYVFDPAFTRKNTDRLLEQIDVLHALSKRRELIWEKISSIEKAVASSIENSNIRQRMGEKLRIGYGILFQGTTKFKRDNFFYTNEVLAFIVFWSILEEVAKDFYIVDWSDHPSDYSWKVRANNKIFVEDKVSTSVDPAHKIITIANYRSRNSKQPFEFHAFQGGNESKFLRKVAREVPLSDQVVGLLYLRNNWDYSRISGQFLTLNGYRNKIDFIHSDPNKIISETIKDGFDPQISFKRCEDMLAFIEALLE